MKNSLKHFPSLFLTSILLLSLCSDLAQASTPIDRVVAIAGDEVITQSELDLIIRSRKEAGQPVIGRKGHWKILRRLIEEQLIIKEARRRGIKVTDSELEFAIQDIQVRNRFPDREALKKAVLLDRLSWEQYIENLRRQLTVLKLLSRAVDTRVALSDEALKEYYHGHPEMFRLPDRVRLKQILLRVPEGSDEREVKQVKEEAGKIRAEAQNGADFSQLVRKYSEERNRQADGDLGFFKKGDLSEEIDKVIFSFKAGGITPPVQTPLGIHIFKIETQEPGQIRPFEEVAQSIREKLMVEKTVALRKGWIDDLWARSHVEIK